jgi:hypothetical protein
MGGMKGKKFFMVFVAGIVLGASLVGAYLWALTLLPL